MSMETTLRSVCLNVAMNMPEHTGYGISKIPNPVLILNQIQ